MQQEPDELITQPEPRNPILVPVKDAPFPIPPRYIAPYSFEGAPPVVVLPPQPPVGYDWVYDYDGSEVFDFDGTQVYDIIIV